MVNSTSTEYLAVVWSKVRFEDEDEEEGSFTSSGCQVLSISADAIT